MSNSPKFSCSIVYLIIQPAPYWVVKSEPTDENWNSAIMSYSALNVKIYRWPQSTSPMVNIFHDTELDAKYGISVEVSMPIQKVCCHQAHDLDMDA